MRCFHIGTVSIVLLAGCSAGTFDTLDDSDQVGPDRSRVEVATTGTTDEGGVATEPAGLANEGVATEPVGLANQGVATEPVGLANQGVATGPVGPADEGVATESVGLAPKKCRVRKRESSQTSPTDEAPQVTNTENIDPNSGATTMRPASARRVRQRVLKPKAVQCKTEALKEEESKEECAIILPESPSLTSSNRHRSTEEVGVADCSEEEWQAYSPVGSMSFPPSNGEPGWTVSILQNDFPWDIPVEELIRDVRDLGIESEDEDDCD